MYLVLIVTTVTIALGLGVKFFFPHQVNKLLTGSTYRDARGVQSESPAPYSVLESLPTGVFILDTELDIKFANPALSKELDVPLDDLLNQQIGNIFDVSGGLEKLLRNFPDKSNGDGKDQQAQVTYTDSEGRKQKLQLLCNRISSGKMDRFVCMVPSLTDQLASEEHYRKTERLQALGEMVSGLAHEINNPLTGVVGFANLLLESSDDSPHEQELQIIQENAQRCKDIIENMLGFIRSDQSDTDELNLNEILANSIKLTRRDFDINNIEIQKNLDPELPPVQGNKTQLEEVFINLLTNAKDELKDYNGGNRIIKVTTKPTPDDFVEVTIEDSGPGIPEEQREEIFEPFFSTKSSGEGTGLGLSIVEGIVDELDGEIRVSNSSLGGASFRIVLPRSKGSKKSLEGQATEAAPSNKLPEETEKIMVVEDEKSIRQLFEAFFDKFNLAGKIVETPLEGIEYLNHERPDYDPDVLFVDLVYPGKLKGRDFIEWIESYREDLLGKIVIMTGNPDDSQTELVDRNENIQLVTKPLSTDELIEVIKKIKGNSQVPA